MVNSFFKIFQKVVTTIMLSVDNASDNIAFVCFSSSSQRAGNASYISVFFNNYVLKIEVANKSQL